MRAAVFEQFGQPLQVRELPDPEPPEDGVVIGVRANGICRSDWHGWMGHDADVRLPHVPGHELAGVVEAVGPRVRSWHVGDRVTVPFACGCGRCAACRRGQLHICEHYFQPGFTSWGSFAQLVAVPYADHNLVRLPEGVDDVTAASLGCRFATAFRAVVDQAAVRPGEWVVVFGCGGVGLSAVMIALAAGARVLAVDPHGEPRRRAEQLGALSLQFDSDGLGSAAESIVLLTDGGAHVTIDAVGHGQVAAEALLSLRRQGRHVQVGLLVGEHHRPRLPMERVIAYELTVRGSHGMPAPDYPQLLSLVVEGRLLPQRLVHQRIPLSQAGEALSRMSQYQGAGVTVIDRFDQ